MYPTEPTNLGVVGHDGVCQDGRFREHLMAAEEEYDFCYPAEFEADPRAAPWLKRCGRPHTAASSAIFRAMMRRHQENWNGSQRASWNSAGY